MSYVLLPKKINLYLSFFIFSFYSASCTSLSESTNEGTNASQTENIMNYTKPIEGENDSLSADVIQEGKVLISYNDCYTCHKEDKASFGPSFRDIAKRYPANKVFIKSLAQKVIVGGSRRWGYAVMLPHPKLSIEDAERMLSYILSLKE